MHSFLMLERHTRDSIISDVSIEKGIHSAIIEKDFWVCYLLDYLFHRCFWKDKVTFKGGTSLSKCYNVIERFSEDIDIMLDWRVLGYGASEPLEGRSRNQQTKFSEAMNEKTSKFLETSFMPELRQYLKTNVKDKVEVSLGESSGSNFDQTVHVRYPRSFSLGSLVPEVRLEIGTLGAWIPNTQRTVKPMLAESYPDVFGEAEIPVRATSIERTFWEKAAILHREANRPAEKLMPLRYSRHYYDLAQIYRHCADDILNSTDLFRDVMAFNEKFYYTAWAGYAEAVEGGLKLSPPAYRHDELKKDLTAMQGMIYGEKTEFDSLLAEIALIEDAVNAALQEGQEPPRP